MPTISANPAATPTPITIFFQSFICFHHYGIAHLP
jgi:hypothetical protein